MTVLYYCALVYYHVCGFFRLFFQARCKRGNQDGLEVINCAFHLCDPGSTLGPEMVCGLSFSRSQPDSEGFSLGTLVFLPQQNRLTAFSISCGAVLQGHTSFVFRGQAPSRQHSSFGPISLSRALSNSVSDCE